MPLGPAIPRQRQLHADIRSQILGERAIQISDPTNAVFGAAEVLSRMVCGEGELDDLLAEPAGFVVIPDELGERFAMLWREQFPDLATIPMDRGLEAAMWHFNKIRKPPEQLMQDEIRHLIAILNIMNAA